MAGVSLALNADIRIAARSARFHPGHSRLGLSPDLVLTWTLPRAIGYVRVSTEQQAESGLGLQAQEAAVTAAASRLGLELARVFADSGIDFDATLVFMCVAGEEQGLIGAGAHAKMAKEKNLPVQAWFNNDIVGNSHGGDGSVDGATIRLYSEGPEDSASRSLAQFSRS